VDRTRGVELVSDGLVMAIGLSMASTAVLSERRHGLSVHDEPGT
jgi:hypothetical protein